MTSEGLGEMFEGDIADMCAGSEDPHRRQRKLHCVINITGCACHANQKCQANQEAMSNMLIMKTFLLKHIPF